MCRRPWDRGAPCCFIWARPCCSHGGHGLYSAAAGAGVRNDAGLSRADASVCLRVVHRQRFLCTKPFKSIVIQPGAESEELMAYLDEMGYPYIQGCLLVGLSLFVETE
ncbi:MAG: hypothetical protein QM215_02840 [Bacillota bacterium]|nr:hypothetical protein [Bacillota bacterium]